MSHIAINNNFANAPRVPGLAFFGTNGEGLIIMRTENDGTVTFETKTIANGLGSNFVSSILVDFDNTIWAGTFHPDDTTQGGLSVSRDFGQTWETFRTDGIYDPLQRRRVDKRTGLRSNNFKDIKRDRLTGRLVMATDDGVISTLVAPSNVLPLTIDESQEINNELQFGAFTMLNGLGSNNVFSILIEEVSVPTVRTSDPNVRTVWWAGTASGLSRSYDQGATWRTFNASANFLDLDGPAITFLAPQNNTTINGLLDILVRANDLTAVRSVEISFDNQNFFPVGFDGTNYTTTFDTRTLDNGRSFLFARSTDTFGNVSQAVPILLNIENPLPNSLLQVEIVEPQENATIADIFPVKIKVTSDAAISRVRLEDSIDTDTTKTAKLIIAPRLVPGSLILFESVYEVDYDTTAINTGDRVQIRVAATDENGRSEEVSRRFLVFNRLPNIQSVAVSGSSIWAGTTNRCGIALSQDKGRNWTFFTTKDGLSSNNVQAVALRRNEVWAGTDNGLNMSSDNGKTWRQFNETIDGLPGQDVRFIAFQGPVVWVGTTNGIGKLDRVGSQFEVFRTTEGLAGRQVNHIFVDCDQTTLWVSTDNGVSRTKNQGRTWTTFRTAQGLASNSTNAITRYKNNIYVATTNGLSVSSNEGASFFRIGTPKLGNDIVLSLKVDGEDLWIGTMNGLTKLTANSRFTTFRREGIFSEIGQQLSTKNIGLKSNIINYLAQ